MRARRSPSSSTPPSRPLALALLAACGLAAGAGCGLDFDPYNRLNSLRLLAVRSEPVAPMSGETTTLSALVYVSPPMGTDPPDVPTYQWSWCPFVGSGTAGYPCLVTEDQLSSLLGRPVSFDLGTGETATLANDFDPATFEAICAGMPGLPPPDCSDGFPVTLTVTVEIPNKVPREYVTAIRPLKLRFRDDQQANLNPTVGALTAKMTAEVIPADGVDAPTLPRAKETDIFATVNIDASSEMYTGTDDNGQPDPMAFEHLTLSWFVETGTTTRERTSYLKDVTDPAIIGTNKWKPALAKDYPRTTAELIVVIRDNRDGVGWTSGIVNLETP